MVYCFSRAQGKNGLYLHRQDIVMLMETLQQDPQLI